VFAARRDAVAAPKVRALGELIAVIESPSSMLRAAIRAGLGVISVPVQAGSLRNARDALRAICERGSHPGGGHWVSAAHALERRATHVNARTQLLDVRPGTPGQLAQSDLGDVST
jgi:hypothetical protein